MSKISDCRLSVTFPIFRSLCLITLNKANKRFTGSISLIWRHDLSSLKDLKSISPFSLKIEIESLSPLLIKPKRILFSHKFDILMFPHFFSDIFNFNIFNKFISLNVLSDLFVSLELWCECGLYVDTDMINETVDMQVDCVEIGWLFKALEHYSVYLTKVAFVLCH